MLQTPHPLLEQIDHSSQPIAPPPEGKIYNDRIAIGPLDPLAAEKWLPTGLGGLNPDSPRCPESSGGGRLCLFSTRIEWDNKNNKINMLS